TFAIGLSVPFILQFFSSQLDHILSYTSIVIGNESESEIYADSHDIASTDLPTGKEKTTSFPVKPIEDIVDTDGAGDAFAGGVVGALLLHQHIEKAIEAGNTLGGLCIGQNEPVLPLPKD
ncbi:unnamed protein product, partial [Tilletia laevis]